MALSPDSVERPLGRVAILGLGLMGGSLARAISDLGLADRITGWSPESTERDAALTAGAVTFAAAEWSRAVSDADLVIVAAPLEATKTLLEQVGSRCPREATVTDVASLKGPLAEVARDAGLSNRWVGSHPMAGSHESGFWASRADLFAGARVWTVGDDVADEVHRQRVRRLWTSLGAKPATIGAEEHDRRMAYVSHVPQLVANALAAALAEAEVQPSELGPGARDMTRLAASSPEVWGDILRHADPAVAETLRSLARILEGLAGRVEEGDAAGIDRVMRDTRTWRGRR
jgi:prephenate dehydrogenase